MMNQRRLAITVLATVLIVLCFLTVSARQTKKVTPNKKKTDTSPAVKPPKVILDYDKLPNLVDVFESMQLSAVLQPFIKTGIVETRHLIHLKDMDFRLLQLDYDLADEHVKTIRAKIAELIAFAATEPKVERLDLEERKKIKYGRLYMTHSVQSFEFMVASFGGPQPMGSLPLMLLSDVGAADDFGCTVPPLLDLTGYIVAVKRGTCTFLTKALAVHATNASALIVVNSEDQLESPASGLGIDPNVNDSMVLSLDRFPIVSLSNASWSKFQQATRHYPPHKLSASQLLSSSEDRRTEINIVPLKCASGGVCAPVTPEEKLLVSEVYWASLALSTADGISHRVFEGITSNFGGRLPLDETLPVKLATPLDACSPLLEPSSAVETSGAYYNNAVVIAVRGTCRFDEKALRVQAAGGRLLVLVDELDQPMQRMGGMHPTAGFVGIPSVMAALPALQFVSQASAGGQSVSVRVSAGSGTAVMDDWIDLAFTEWAETDDEQLIQIEGLAQKYSHNKHTEVVDWLRRKEATIKTKDAKDEL